MEIRKILLPVEFEGASSALAHQAAGIARRFGAAIVVLNVVTPLSYGAGILEGNYVPTGREDLLAELIREARKDVDASLASELAGLPVKRLLVEGDPAAEIVKAARNENADLIMMPTHGRKGFRRFLLGSVTAKILHDSHLPVWTGAHLDESRASAEFAVRHVVCGLDLGSHSAKLLSWAAQFAARCQHADILIVGRKPSAGHLGGTGYAIVRESRIPVLSVRQASANS